MTKHLLEHKTNLMADEIAYCTVIGYSDGLDRHLQSLQDLFKKVRTKNLKIKLYRTKFCYPGVEFMGHIV